MRSSEAETIGLGRWWALCFQAAPFGAAHLLGLARYRWLGERGKPLVGPLPGKPPQTPWIAAIDDALANEVEMDEVFRAHSDRSWYFARVLAAGEGRALDDETLYAACLLHDAGLFVEDRGNCFAEVGARMAHSTAATAGVSSNQARAAEVAVATHIDVTPRTQMALYLRAGTLLDVIGRSAWTIDPAAIAEACGRWPRTGFGAEARRRWNQEADKFPYGRAAFARRPGFLPELIRCNPLPD